MGFGEGMSLSPLGEGSGEEALPPPQKILDFFLSNQRILRDSEVQNVVFLRNHNVFKIDLHSAALAYPRC